MADNHHIKLDNIALRPAVFETQHCGKSETQRMTAELPEACNLKIILYILNIDPRGPNFTPFRSTTSRFRDTSLSKIENAPNDPKWPQSLNCQKYPVYTQYPPPRVKFHSVSLYDEPFSRYKAVENPKCTKWPQNDLKNLTVKSTRIHWIFTPETQILLRFALRPAVFRDTRLSKIGNAPKIVEWAHSHLNVKSTMYTLNTHPRGKTFTLLHSTTRRFRDTRLSKIVNRPNEPRMTLST